MELQDIQAADNKTDFKGNREQAASLKFKPIYQNWFPASAVHGRAQRRAWLHFSQNAETAGQHIKLSDRVLN